MRIRFTKGNGKPDTLTCIREDGSVTWAPLNFTTHDFGHYALETTLGRHGSFFGLLARGWEIASFGQADPATGRKPAVPVEAVQTEALAGLLDMERRSGCPATHAAFTEMLAVSCDGSGLPTPSVSSAQLAAVRACQADLLRRWHSLPPGEALELNF